MDPLERLFAFTLFASRSVSASINGQQQPLFPTHAYTIAFIGDSMTDYLRGGQDSLRSQLQTFYPNKDFVFYNYGFGSTNIASVIERLDKDTTYQGQSYPAVMGQQYDVIILESFANNPLIRNSMSESISDQNKALDAIVTKIKNKRPRSLLVFLATISPSNSHYGEGVVDLNMQERVRWAEERKQLLENHILYAKSHRIPVLDVYSKSTTLGDRAEMLVNTTDHIHPSIEGIDFLVTEIAQQIHDLRIIPL